MGNQSPTMTVEHAKIGNSEVIEFWDYQIHSLEDGGTARHVLHIELENGKLDRVVLFNSEREYFAADGYFGNSNMSLVKAQSVVRNWVVMACSRQRRLEEKAEMAKGL